MIGVSLRQVSDGCSFLDTLEYKTSDFLCCSKCEVNR